MESQDTLLKDRYSVIKSLGRGGMGEVFLAEDTLLSRKVAVKKVVYSDNELLLKAAEKEATVLARLQNQSLPKVLDYFGRDQAQYIVMEYISGKDLGEMLQANGAPFPAEKVLSWADTLLNILEYLHNQSPPVVHRDIKPQNIKITDDGRLFLLDFGLVKDTPTRVRGESMSLSVYGYSQSYAPLEQINGDPTSVQTDVYELCATLYHLLTNVKPADALDRATKKIEHKPDPLRPAHEVNPNVPLALSEILESGLRLSCDERVKSAYALRQLLNELRTKRARINIEVNGNNGRGDDVPTPAPPKPAPAGGRRKWYAIAAGAVVVLAITSVMGYRLVKGSGAQRQFESARAVERSEGILSRDACAKYNKVEADYLDSNTASDLERKLRDCSDFQLLVQRAETLEKERGLNHEVSTVYNGIVEKYPGSAYDNQAKRKVGEFETNKKATLRAWKEKQDIDEAQGKGGLPSQYLRELSISYAKISLDDVDPILVSHIKDSAAILNEGKELMGEVEPEIMRLTEAKKKEVKEWCEKEHPYLTQWCIDDWWEKNREAFQQGTMSGLTTRYKARDDSITKRFNDITQKDDDISSQLTKKYKAEFIDRVKERLGSF